MSLSAATKTSAQMVLACEQALLFGRVKRVSRERACPNRRACSQAKMVPGGTLLICQLFLRAKLARLG